MLGVVSDGWLWLRPHKLISLFMLYDMRPPFPFFYIISTAGREKRDAGEKPDRPGVGVILVCRPIARWSGASYKRDAHARRWKLTKADPFMQGSMWVFFFKRI